MNPWHLSIPKILHVYWGFDTLPYMRYLTVKSFIHFNPDWKVVLWKPEGRSVKNTWKSNHQSYSVDCDDYLANLLGITPYILPIKAADFNIPEGITDVHISDFLRLQVLSTTGGVWSDMDVIYFKPITELKVNTEDNKYIDTFVCMRDHNAYIHSGGFLMADMYSRYYECLKVMAKSYYNIEDYQCVGVNMYNKVFSTLDSVQRYTNAENIGMDAVYAHDALHVKELINGAPLMFTKDSIGCHWYGGHPQWGKFIKDTNGGLTNLPDCVIGNLIKDLKLT